MNRAAVMQNKRTYKKEKESYYIKHHTTTEYSGSWSFYNRYYKSYTLFIRLMGQNEILPESTKKDSLLSSGLWAIPVKVKKKYEIQTRVAGQQTQQMMPLKIAALI